MKAFLSRLHIGSSPRDKEKDSVRLPPLRPWPPPDPPRPAPSAAPAYTVFKPLPDIVPSQLSAQLAPRSDLDVPRPPDPPAIDPPAPIARNGTNNSAASSTPSDVTKKVAFRSPPPTPTTPSAADPPPALPDDQPKPAVVRNPPPSTREPRGSVATATTSTAASSSKTDITAPSKPVPKPASTRATSPYLFKSLDASSAQSFRSPTPYSNMSAQTTGSRILSAQSWSEVTEEDLVCNLGSRERTRQEVLFEIISSEERYVMELTKMKETFVDPLLHPFSVNVRSPPASPAPHIDYDTFRSESPVESFDLLPPIAARFMSPTPTPPKAKDSHTLDGVESMESEDDEGDDQLGKTYDKKRADASLSPYRAATPRGPGAVPFPSRSHQSLPAPSRLNPKSASTSSLGRQSTIVGDRERKVSQGQTSTPPHKTGVLRKFRKSQTAPDDVLGGVIAPHQLPEDLRLCLEVIDGGVLDGHKKLCDALRKRYEDQFPLVRSLADVFVVHSEIFRGYATYVLHLERALEQVDSALANQATKKPSKQDAGEWQKVCTALRKLEEVAYERGETGLAITLSKPFQRLLKYPLLFQNLLFHTDPSTFEYETTLQMVAEIEAIVRSIEDEKIQKEERDKTRDVFARIDGLDKVKQLALPKPSRVLVEERPYNPVLNLGSNGASSPPPVINGKGVKGKSSLKRLSDVLSGAQGIGGKKDLWHVVFNDVVLLCQRTGTTSLPLVSSTTSRTNSLPELQGKAKYASTGRRNSHTKPRNLYKFIKIETWAIGDVVQPKEGVVSMDEVARSRAKALSSQPRIVPLPEDDDERDNDSDDSDKKSKMSFSYWGADKMTVVQRPVIKTRMGANPRKGLAMASYQRVSSANAKFGTRLVSDSTSPNGRPVSRRTMQSNYQVRRPPPSSEEGPNYARSTANRAAWDQGTRTTTPASIKSRARNTSQNSAATRTTTATTNAKGLASPAPSNDSGVGLYGQIVANDPDFSQA